MANKKLKLEVELETAKAKRQAAQIGDVSSPSAPTASSKSTDKLAKATELNSRQMLSMTRAFTGMAVGLAATYSSRYFDRGSTAEKALSYGGSTITGAMSGAMMGRAAGPQGMAIGAAAGGMFGFLKEYLDRDKVKSDMTKDFKESEQKFARNENFSNEMKRITSPFNTEGLSVKLATLSDQYVFYAEMIKDLKASIEESISAGKMDDVQKLRGLLEEVRGRKSTIWSIAEKMDNAASGSPVGSRTATSALQKIGGGWGLPTVGNRGGEVGVLLNGMEVTNTLLREIRDITSKKGGSWL